MSIRKNTLINLAGSIIPMVVMLVTVPLYLDVLGDIRYGALVLVWLIIGYFSFLEMGLGKATANHIARLPEAQVSERSTVFWTALLVNGAFGLIAGFILWLIGDYLLTGVLKMPEEFQEEALVALPWMIATLPLALVSSVLNGALEGRNQFLAVNILQVSSNVVFQFIPLFAAYIYGPSLAVVIPAAVLSRALMNIPFLMACYAFVPLARQPNFSIRAAKSLFSFGSWVALTGAIGPLLDTMDRFLIGVVIGAQAVTHYAIPMQLVGKVKIIPGSLSRALFPRFSADPSADADALALNSLRVLLLVITPVVIFGIVLLQPFMQLWVGKDLSDIAAPLGEILFFGVWINSLAHIPYFLLQGKGRPDIVAKLHAIEIVPFLLFLWGAMHLWGIYGAVVVWTARVTLEAGLLFRLSGMPKNTLRVIGGPAVMVIIAIVTAQSIVNQNWYWRIGVALSSVVSVGVWCTYSNGHLGFSKTLFK